MIKFLDSIIQTIKENNWLLLTMATNPLFLRKSVENQDLMYRIIGEHTVRLYKMEQIQSTLLRIWNYCKSELEGTYYKDHLKQWEGTDVQTEYKEDTCFKDIIGCWDNHPLPEIDELDKIFYETTADFDNKMSEGLFKFFPGIDVFKKYGDNMEKTNLSEMQMKSALDTGHKLSVFDEFNKNTARIKEIAENKGNLGEIMKILDQ